MSAHAKTKHTMIRKFTLRYARASGVIRVWHCADGCCTTVAATVKGFNTKNPQMVPLVSAWLLQTMGKRDLIPPSTKSVALCIFGRKLIVDWPLVLLK